MRVRWPLQSPLAFWKWWNVRDKVWSYLWGDTDRSVWRVKEWRLNPEFREYHPPLPSSNLDNRGELCKERTRFPRECLRKEIMREIWNFEFLKLKRIEDWKFNYSPAPRKKIESNLIMHRRNDRVWCGLIIWTELNDRLENSARAVTGG